MRVSLCLGVVLCWSSGCFLDHGAPGEEMDRAASPASPYRGICSLSAAAVYPKALTFYRLADCHEPTPSDVCAVEGPTHARDRSPRLSVTTERLSTRAEHDAECGAAPTLVSSMTCDLPIEGVGDYDVIVDGEDALHLTIPYDSPVGASCWTFAGWCETGGVWRLDLPEVVGAGEPRLFEVASLYDLDTPVADGCVVTIEDGGTTSPIEIPRITVRLTFDDGPPPATCVGIGRGASCVMPPLDPGRYEVVTPDEGVRALEVI